MISKLVPDRDELIAAYRFTNIGSCVTNDGNMLIRIKEMIYDDQSSELRHQLTTYNVSIF